MCMRPKGPILLQGHLGQQLVGPFGVGALQAAVALEQAEQLLQAAGAVGAARAERAELPHVVLRVRQNRIPRRLMTSTGARCK